jgi:hypothetical protein
MTNQNENRIRQAEQTADRGAKKKYQTPELTVHGRVDEITRFLPFANPISHH